MNVDPGNLFEHSRERLALKIRHGEEQQMHMAATRIFVLIAGQFTTNSRVNFQLFPQLARQRLLRRFAQLYFAARKLPLERMPIRLPALSNQNLSVAMNNARRDEQRTAISNIQAGLDSVAINCRKTYGKMPPLR